MKINNWSSLLLSILLLVSLVTPFLISIAVTSVGTVKASPGTIFSDNFDNAIDSASQYDSWGGGATAWAALSSNTGGPKQGSGRLGLLESGTSLNPWIKTPSFATTAYENIQISFMWTMELDSATKVCNFVAQWSTDGTTWTNIAGTTYVKETDGNQKIISNVSVSSNDNVANKAALWIRWYNYLNTGSGTRDKVSFDNVVISGSQISGGRVNVSISPSQKSGFPENTLTYTVVTKNVGTILDNYNLTVSDNDNWGPTLNDNQFLNVGPNENRTTTLHVTVPAGAAGGTDDLITVTATSQENASIKDNDTCNAVVAVPQTVTPENFTIVALPDTQYYSQSYPSVFNSQTNWIVSHDNENNIVFVTHLGDIVDVNNNNSQWVNGNAAMSILDNKVPYTVLPGNHDMDGGYSPLPGAGAAYYETYFPASRFENYPYWGGSYDSSTVTSSSPNMNNYQLFSAGGMNFINISLQYNPTADVRSWADNILREYSNRRAIISTHSYLNIGGSLTGNGGTQIYNDLVSKENNVFLVLCGHNFNAGAMVDKIDYFGDRRVDQLLSDYQDMTSGGNGYMRIMKFVPSENKIYVSTYSPYAGTNLTDATNQFTIPYPMAVASGVSVLISPGSQKGLNGVTLDYTVTVTNTENISDNFSLTVSDNDNWAPTVSQTSLVVPAFSSGSATLTVTVPLGAREGTFDNIRVRATSNDNTSVFGDESCLAQVTIVRGFTASISPGSQSGANGATLTYTVRVNNIGIVNDNYSLSVTDNDNWSPSVLPTSLSVQAGKSGNSTLSVLLGIGVDAITVHVTNDNTTGEATCTATGLPISISFTPSVRYGWPGDNLAYTVVVKNLENSSDNYRLTLTYTQPWQTGWTPPTGISTPPMYKSNNINVYQDTYVMGYTPTTNYGSIYNMYVGTYYSQPEWTYTQWNLSSIPANATIDNAYVYLTGQYGPSQGYPNYIPDNMWVAAWKVNNDNWNENAMTWNTKPGYGTLLDNKLWVASTWAGYDNWVSWNATSWVQNQFENGKLASFAFTSDGVGTDGVSGNSGWLQTKDDTSTLWDEDYIPYLLVSYHVPAYTLSLGSGENWTGTVWVITGTSGSDGNIVTVTSMTDNTITAGVTAQAIANAGSIGENISPPAITVTTPGTYTFTVTLTNLGNLPDNFKLVAVDNENWQPTLGSSTLGPIAAGGSENVTLSVTVPLGAAGGTVDNITVTATSKTDNRVSYSKNCTLSVFNASVNIRLATSQMNPPFLYGIYKAYVNVNLTVDNGDNLRLRFLGYDNRTVENEIVIWSRTAPGAQTVILSNLIVSHDNNLSGLGAPSDFVKRMKLVLTDNAGAIVLDNMAWFKVVQDDWGDRISWIVINWALHSGSQQDKLGDEISTIVLNWALVPTGPRDQHDFS